MQSSILLLQREVPESVNVKAAKCAHDNQVTVILDMGGRDDPISNELVSLCDVISPNQTEVRRLLADSTTKQEFTEEIKGDDEYDDV